MTMTETGHILSNSACGISDWLAMTIMSGLAFGLAILVLLAAAALCRYLFTGTHSVSR